MQSTSGKAYTADNAACGYVFDTLKNAPSCVRSSMGFSPSSSSIPWTNILTR